MMPGDAPMCYASVAAIHAHTGPTRDGIVTWGGVEADGYFYQSWLSRNTGGQILIARHGGRYCVIAGGGGAMDIDTIVAAGVPRAIARRLYERMNRRPQ